MQNKKPSSLLFKLIRLGLDTEQDTEFPILTEQEWMELVELGKRLAMTGMMFSGIEKLPQEKRPQKGILLGLIDKCLRIEKMNSIHNRKVAAVYRLFEEAELKPVIMKGQGLATLYPCPQRRMPGDVDVWVIDDFERAKGFVMQRDPQAIASRRHIQSKKDREMTVEVHTVPAVMFNPFSTKWLKSWFGVMKEKAVVCELPEGAGRIMVPDDGMYRVFLLVHKYMHFLCGGIGMKQMTDYMMLLRKGFTEEEKRESVRIIMKLNMGKFCRAVMYVLKEKLGMEDRYLLMEPDCKAGEILMEEILTTGNFGFYDGRYKTDIGFVKRLTYRLKRRWMMVRYFGTEPLWDYYNRVFGKEEID